jgi:hypothetical protein
MDSTEEIVDLLLLGTDLFEVKYARTWTTLVFSREQVIESDGATLPGVIEVECSCTLIVHGEVLSGDLPSSITEEGLVIARIASLCGAGDNAKVTEVRLDGGSLYIRFGSGIELEVRPEKGNMEEDWIVHERLGLAISPTLWCVSCFGGRYGVRRP